jgi:hypothetical protein
MWCAWCGWLLRDDVVLDHGAAPYHPACRAIRGEILVEEPEDD